MRVVFFIISILLLLPSCRKGEVPSSSTDTSQDTEDTSPIEVHLSTNLLISVENQSFGRAPIDGSQLPEGGFVGVYGVLANESQLGSININNETEPTLKNAKYKVYADGSLGENYAEYPMDYDGLMLYAYYPYSENLMAKGNDMIERITLPNTEMENAVDYLYIEPFFKETPENSFNNETVKLKFKHALSLIRLNFLKSTSSVRISDVVVYVNASPGGMFYVNNGNCYPNNKNSNTYSFNKSADLIYGDFTLDLLMYPGVEVEKIACWVNDLSYVTIYNASTVTDDKIINLVKGERVTINFKYAPKNLSFTNSLEIWGDSDQMDFEFEETGTVTQN